MEECDETVRRIELAAKAHERNYKTLETEIRAEELNHLASAGIPVIIGLNSQKGLYAASVLHQVVCIVLVLIFRMGNTEKG